ncbi:MAG: hypothetical protein A2048_02060 [Deltaproteobacteria bacterium GWA2_45_12]|nr:MAG: hypothetical protein A2048_02060 [Deltaproteobacteria bacterium GWA2_45_12]
MTDLPSAITLLPDQVQLAYDLIYGAHQLAQKDPPYEWFDIVRGNGRLEDTTARFQLLSVLESGLDGRRPLEVNSDQAQLIQDYLLCFGRVDDRYVGLDNTLERGLHRIAQAGGPSALPVVARNRRAIVDAFARSILGHLDPKALRAWVRTQIVLLIGDPETLLEVLKQFLPDIANIRIKKGMISDQTIFSSVHDIFKLVEGLINEVLTAFDQDPSQFEHPSRVATPVGKKVDLTDGIKRARRLLKLAESLLDKASAGEGVRNVNKAIRDRWKALNGLEKALNDIPERLARAENFQAEAMETLNAGQSLFDILQAFQLKLDAVRIYVDTARFLRWRKRSEKSFVLYQRAQVLIQECRYLLEIVLEACQGHDEARRRLELHFLTPLKDLESFIEVGTQANANAPECHALVETTMRSLALKLESYRHAVKLLTLLLFPKPFFMRTSVPRNVGLLVPLTSSSQLNPQVRDHLPDGIVDALARGNTFAVLDFGAVLDLGQQMETPPEMRRLHPATEDDLETDVVVFLHELIPDLDSAASDEYAVELPSRAPGTESTSAKITVGDFFVEVDLIEPDAITLRLGVNADTKGTVDPAFAENILRKLFAQLANASFWEKFSRILARPYLRILQPGMPEDIYRLDAWNQGGTWADIDLSVFSAEGRLGDAAETPDQGGFREISTGGARLAQALKGMGAAPGDGNNPTEASHFGRILGLTRFQAGDPVPVSSEGVSAATALQHSFVPHVLPRPLNGRIGSLKDPGSSRLNRPMTSRTIPMSRLRFGPPPLRPTRIPGVSRYVPRPFK